MVDPELLDLVPLYLTESRRRLEHLLEIAPQVASAPAAAEARRELHTLKGSSRMLKLLHIADLCHNGEALLQEPEETAPAELTALLDQLNQFLDDLARGQLGEDPGEEPSADQLPPPPEWIEAGPAPERRPAEGPEVDPEALIKHRISVEGADRLTASMASMRLLSITGLATSRRLGELALLAEGGVTEALPRQVLAMLSSHLRRVASDLESNQRRLQRHAESQLSRLLDLQLQPLRPFLQSLARHARELARALGKEIEVEIEGGEARLDQRIVGELRGAFLHLVANAVDHGIEEPGRRFELGKPRAGRLHLVATSHADRVEIVVTDDGAGVDPARVLEAAREAGLLAPKANDLVDSEALQLLFTTGFTTRREVSQVSGRGVGLDAVASVVRQLGGDVWLRSEPGRGSSVFVEVPAARRGERVLVLRCGQERLALPKSAVAWVRGAQPGDLLSGSGRILVEADGELLRVISAARLLGTEEPAAPVLVALQVAESKRVLAVEDVEGDEEVLLRPFAPSVPVPDYYTGLALLTSGEPVAVLSPRALVSHLRLARAARPAAPSPDRLRVLLVEDSLVTREMERRMLEEEGFQVTATAGAEEALRRLGRESYDCLVTDLEMPGMDGFELTRHVRGTRTLAQLPIVMVTTRDDPGDRLAGLEAGADAYVSKQSLESHTLAGIIRRLGSGG